MRGETFPRRTPCENQNKCMTPSTLDNSSRIVLLLTNTFINAMTIHEPQRRSLIRMAKILIIDDTPINIKTVGEILRDRHHIIVATDGQGGIELASSESPDLILLDVMMPGMDGFAVCRALKERPETASIPVILTTALTGTDDIVRGFDSGAVDYITKPFNPRELIARVSTHLEIVKARNQLAIYAESLEEMSQRLLDKTLQLSASACTDHLTGLANRMHMMELLRQGRAQSRRSGRPFALIIADIDHFKNINDTHGHDCGDHVLTSIADIMRAVIREQDMLARWGGEEFLFLLPETDTAGAAILAEKIRKTVESERIAYQDTAISVTLTFGVAPYDPETDIDVSIKRADAALYEGKRGGRNRVVTAPTAARS